MSQKILLGLFAGLFIWLSACERPDNFVSEGTLDFNVDTLKFDSIFVNFLTPSERLIAINQTGKNVKVSRIWLESGDQTEFNMIVDGIQANDVEDIDIADDDSVHIFVNLKSELRDNFKEEYIAFQIGDEIQRILIRAFVVDGFLLRARLTQNNDSLVGYFFGRSGITDTTLTAEKPIIMDGPLIIPEGVTVRIEAGTELFFTPYKVEIPLAGGGSTFAFFSTLIVSGTLIVEGTPDDPVIFQGSRFDEDYTENPAQWRGVRFTQTSSDNILRHTLIKNGVIGLEVDSLTSNGNPKVLVQQSEIRNMSAYGVLGLAVSAAPIGSPPSLLMENSIVHNCKDRTLFLNAGGNYGFYNCTFANFNFFFSRNKSQFLFSNYFIDANDVATVYPMTAQLTNCIIWGSEDSEIALDTLPGIPLDFNMDHCLVRYDFVENEVNIRPYLSNHFENLDPEFNDPREFDYRPKSSSPVINTGIDFPTGSTGYFNDFRGRADSLRYDGFDIGALEYYPIVE